MNTLVPSIICAAFLAAITLLDAQRIRRHASILTARASSQPLFKRR